MGSARCVCCGGKTRFEVRWFASEADETSGSGRLFVSTRDRELADQAFLYMAWRPGQIVNLYRLCSRRPPRLVSSRR